MFQSALPKRFLKSYFMEPLPVIDEIASTSLANWSPSFFNDSKNRFNTPHIRKLNRFILPLLTVHLYLSYRLPLTIFVDLLQKQFNLKCWQILPSTWRSLGCWLLTNNNFSYQQVNATFHQHHLSCCLSLWIAQTDFSFLCKVERVDTSFAIQLEVFWSYEITPRTIPFPIEKSRLNAFLSHLSLCFHFISVLIQVALPSKCILYEVD